MVYRVGLPLWRLFANLGFAVKLRVNVAWDPEAMVFVADSPDLHGLVAEAHDVDTLRTEVQSSIDELLQLQLKKSNTKSITIYRDMGLATG